MECLKKLYLLIVLIEEVGVSAISDGLRDLTKNSGQRTGGHKVLIAAFNYPRRHSKILRNCPDKTTHK
jgi:hypothetical protein